MSYTILGQPLAVQRELDGIFAETSYAYDSADHVTQITYPDGEVVVNQYNEVGGVRLLMNQSGTPIYLDDLTYDIFGRPRVIDHGNTTVDTRTYHGASLNDRLSTVQVTKSGESYPRLSYSYSNYWAQGLLRSFQDTNTHRSRSTQCHSSLNDTANVTYDGIGQRARTGFGNSRSLVTEALVEEYARGYLEAVLAVFSTAGGSSAPAVGRAAVAAARNPVTYVQSTDFSYNFARVPTWEGTHCLLSSSRHYGGRLDSGLDEERHIESGVWPPNKSW